MAADGREPGEVPVRVGWVFSGDLGQEVGKARSFSVFRGDAT